MLQSRIIFEKANESGIDLKTAMIEEIIPVCKNALIVMERKFDVPDNSSITYEDINMLDEDLRFVISILHELRDKLYNNIAESMNNKRDRKNTKIIENNSRAVRSIEQVKRKIRDALDELYIASNMFKASKIRLFRKCFRNFQTDLSQASSAFILMEIHLKEVNLSQRIIEVNHDNIDEKSRPSKSQTIPEENDTFIKSKNEKTDAIINLTKAAGYSSEAIRELIVDSFDEGDLDFFCYDYFFEVYNKKFAINMDKPMKAQQIIEYCLRNKRIDYLLDLLKEKSPVQYKEHQKHLVR